MIKSFEQYTSGCKCGGNCQCNKATNEAKKYKFKDLAKAWQHVYGEDMEDEYPAIYQEVTGAYKDKVTKSDLADIWNKVYGEDVADEYDGFFNSLKENLEEAEALDGFNSIDEGKAEAIVKLPDLDLNRFQKNKFKKHLAKHRVKVEHVKFDATGKAELTYSAESKDDLLCLFKANGGYYQDGFMQRVGESLEEANADGTISPDEDGLRDKLLLETELAITEFLDALKEKSYGIGGKFRGPGILAENMKIVQDKVKRFK